MECYLRAVEIYTDMVRPGGSRAGLGQGQVKIYTDMVTAGGYMWTDNIGCSRGEVEGTR